MIGHQPSVSMKVRFFGEESNSCRGWNAHGAILPLHGNLKWIQAFLEGRSASVAVCHARNNRNFRERRSADRQGGARLAVQWQVLRFERRHPGPLRLGLSPCLRSRYKPHGLGQQCRHSLRSLNRRTDGRMAPHLEPQNAGQLPVGGRSFKTRRSALPDKRRRSDRRYGKAL